MARAKEYIIVCSIGMDWSTDSQNTVCVCDSKADALKHLRYIAECSKKAGKRPMLDEVNGELLIREDGIGRTSAYEIVEAYC